MNNSIRYARLMMPTKPVMISSIGRKPRDWKVSSPQVMAKVISSPTSSGR